MMKLSLFVQIPRLSESPTACNLMVQPTSQSAPNPSHASTKVEQNGDILQTVQQSSGYDGSVITFFLSDLRYTFDTVHPIQVSETAPSNCNPPNIGAFPPGIPQPTNPTPTSFKFTLPSETALGMKEYYYWIQVHGPGGTKWLHPKIRNDTISKHSMRHPTFHNFLEYPLIALAVIAAVVFVAATLGVLVGNALNRRK